MDRLFRHVRKVPSAKVSRSLDHFPEQVTYIKSSVRYFAESDFARCMRSACSSLFSEGGGAVRLPTGSPTAMKNSSSPAGQRVAMIAVMALVRLVQHAALRVGRTGNDQRAAGGGKTWAHRVQDLSVSTRGEFVAVPEGRLVGDDSNVSWTPQSPEARRANLDVDAVGQSERVVRSISRSDANDWMATSGTSRTIRSASNAPGCLGRAEIARVRSIKTPIGCLGNLRAS